MRTRIATDTWLRFAEIGASKAILVGDANLVL